MLKRQAWLAFICNPSIWELEAGESVPARDPFPKEQKTNKL